MKRILIIVALVIIVYFGVTTVTNGFENETIKLDVISYENLQKKSDDLTMAVNRYNQKNDTEYEAEVATLNNSVKKYKTSKAQYESLIEELELQGELNQVIEEKIIYSSKDVYNVDFLQTRIGTYANQHGLILTLQLVSGNYMDPLATSQDFTVCNLGFMVTGTYENIAEFLYKIEGDDELGFEIRDFSMKKNEADFTVYNIRVSNSSLLKMQEQSVMPNNSNTETNNSSSSGSATTTQNSSTTGNTTTTTPSDSTGATTTTNDSTSTTPVGNTAQ